MLHFEERRRASTRTKTFPAPARGWIQSGNIVVAPEDAAERLDNFFPTSQGARLRSGKALHATLDATPVRFMPYRSGSTGLLYASTAGFVYEISAPGSTTTTPAPVLAGLGSGDWSSVQFATAGGEFMVAVNGTDLAFYSDGSDVNPLTDETVYDLPFDGLSGEFEIGDTVTGKTSGATAEILAISKTGATTGVLKLGAITGTFSDNETIYGPTSGGAILANEEFTSDISGWTDASTGTGSVAWSSGAAALTNPDGSPSNRGSLNTSFVSAPGQPYMISWEWGTAVDVGLHIYVGTTAGASNLSQNESLTTGAGQALFTATTSETFIESTGSFDEAETVNLLYCRVRAVQGSALANIPSGTNTASSITVTNVATSALSQVWAHKSRLWFVQKDTQDAWYLPSEAIGGAATKFPLGSVFNKGGALLFGATWSADSGDGLDDQCVFVSEQGEIAVYQGTDPGSASTWALVGVYEIGKPLDKHAHFRLGGNLAIVAEEGITPITDAVQKDRAALTESALTYPIEDAWQDAIARRSVATPITATLWRDQAMLMIGTPSKVDGQEVAFVANARTGAWARYTGWDVRCSVEYDGNLYFGETGGGVYQGETGGDDAGVAYTGVYVPKFSECGTPNYKQVNFASLTARGRASFGFAMGAFSDYAIGTVPSAPPIAQTAGVVWGDGTKWGSGAKWGGDGVPVAQSEWRAVYAAGQAIAPVLVMTSNQSTAPDIEILTLRVRYETGAIL